MKSLILIVGIFLMLGTSCSSYVCPTYSSVDKPIEHQEEVTSENEGVRI